MAGLEEVEVEANVGYYRFAGQKSVSRGTGRGVRQSTTTTTTTINLNNIYCYREINWPEFADIETHANVLEGGCYLLSPSNPSFFTRYGKLRAIPIDTTTATNPIR